DDPDDPIDDPDDPIDDPDDTLDHDGVVPVSDSPLEPEDKTPDENAGQAGRDNLRRYGLDPDNTSEDVPKIDLCNFGEIDFEKIEKAFVKLDKNESGQTQAIEEFSGEISTEVGKFGHPAFEIKENGFSALIVLPENKGAVNSRIASRPQEKLKHEVSSAPINNDSKNTIETLDKKDPAKFKILPPYIHEISSKAGSRGNYLEISGDNFSSKNSLSRVSFFRSGKVFYSKVISWNDNGIRCKVPQLPSGNYWVTVVSQNGGSNSKSFKIL
ncbi:MAG: IPT/TIG domain-containing protein, partial [Candidatus Omnitrophica bacterium]|nr:IPT/TIG domain-containing protein [Candidatus Omnitrophota bacterium]